MTMKVSTTNNNGGNAIARNLMAPIPLYPKQTVQFLGSKQQKKPWMWLQCDHSWSASWSHECGLTCKQIYLSPFDTGSVEQWLKFLTKLNLIITRNGLTTHLVKFNLMQLWLKGEALQHFNNKAEELENQTNAHHAECISAVCGHIFPKSTLQMQKCYLQKVHLHNPMISKCFTWWHQQNDYFALFPPHGGVAQKISDDKIIELIYGKLLNSYEKWSWMCKEM